MPIVSNMLGMGGATISPGKADRNADTVGPGKSFAPASSSVTNTFASTADAKVSPQKLPSSTTSFPKPPAVVMTMLNAGLSGLNFSHFLGKEPHLKFEVGGEIPEGLVPAQPQPPAQAFEGEHLPAETAPRHQRNRNKNRNRNRSH